MLDRLACLMATALVTRISRRRAIQLAATGAIVPLALACRGSSDSAPATEPAGDGTPVTEISAVGSTDESASGKLSAKPDIGAPAGDFTTGLQALGLERDEDAIVYVAESYTHGKPVPLAVLFHGAGGDARGAIELFLPHADTRGMLLLAIRSRQRSWDVTAAGTFGPDIAFLDRALRMVFARYAIDAERIAVAGFSDGASYALSVGLTNGALFSAIVAFSPGFVAPGEAEGMPRIFISHGTNDIVLPIEQTGRLIASQLASQGYAVEFVEFDGLHMVPDEIIDDALAWWLDNG